jgi:hypothetical protein
VQGDLRGSPKKSSTNGPTKRTMAMITPGMSHGIRPRERRCAELATGTTWMAKVSQYPPRITRESE